MLIMLMDKIQKGKYVAELYKIFILLIVDLYNYSTTNVKHLLNVQFYADVQSNNDIHWQSTIL